jgi:hypothetical protein
MFRAWREKRFARSTARRLLALYAEASARRPELSGKALYREVLLHSPGIDSSRVDQILLQAEHSFDEWSERDSESLSFRQVVTFIVMSQYLESGRQGAVISFKDVVFAIVPPEL